MKVRITQQRKVSQPADKMDDSTVGYKNTSYSPTSDSDMTAITVMQFSSLFYYLYLNMSTNSTVIFPYYFM